MSIDAKRGETQGSYLTTARKNPFSGPDWPVLWSDRNTCLFFVPRPGTAAERDPHFERDGEPYAVSRTAGIVLLHQFWNSVWHVGSTPGYNERTSILGRTHVDAEASIEWANAVAELGNDPHGRKLRCPPGSKTFYTAAAIEGLAACWLLDSGACQHLTGKKVISDFQDQVRKGKPMTFITANKKVAVDDVGPIPEGAGHRNYVQRDA